uniref:FLYWCH-type domain-containing protein n=1 Tax=Ditylenchus dipsaci TaxID=166011 RepID=A0A915CMM7_9BILA
MDANNFMREGRLSIGAISQAMGIEQNALMEFVQNALNAVPAPVVQAILPAINQDQPEVEEENDTISFVKSERGKDKAVHRGFQFQKHKTNKNGSTQYWQCVKYQTLNGGCKARLTTLTAGDVFSKLLPHDGNRLHNHALDPMAVPKSNIMANLKRRALDTRELPKELLNHELQTAPLALGPSLTDSATRKIIRNYRKAHQIPVVEASNVQNLTFSDASKMYVDAAGQEQLFVLKDSGRKDPQRIVLLGKERNIDWSVEMKITYWDGSFSITPAPFYQVYAILAERTSRDSNGGKWFSQ